MSAGKTVKDDDALEEAMERPGTMLNTQSHRPIAGAERPRGWRVGPWKSGKILGLKQPSRADLRCFTVVLSNKMESFDETLQPGCTWKITGMVALQIPKPGMNIILLLVVGCCCSMST